MINITQRGWRHILKHHTGTAPGFLSELYRLIECALNQRQILHAIPD